ncbi:hypothetical protein SAMN02746065_10545 [Desulfocicer vacuolatum DSM 3385]|uniref:UPF0246 protein SAMN02746065_10545 n=1 Tax=Desulfocicer vacuolatum DSM 3385 TaxID=1121400 RepID=A0A1W2AG26_9BACT|nr:peroxide stress protein YaaA [Desulfocicer vacuolatum]SMC59540.1 hypothetical protein SAMN02746065_10545 [Desulfocicer vacuolatum DSM 3385]
MISVISPSKTLDFQCIPHPRYTMPALLPHTQVLADHMKTLSQKNLESLMKISPKLSALNHQRYQTFHMPFNPENARQALLAFKGDVYRGIELEQYCDDDLDFAQEHLRILSGFYGLLRPLDLIQPYRLEMGTRLSGEWGKNLYAFWKNRITEQLTREMDQSRGEQVLVNLASQEYFKAIQPKAFKIPILTVLFKEKKGDNFKVIGIHAKRARGLMVNFIIKNRIEQTENLKKFTDNGYCFNPDLSSTHEWVFTRG